MDRFFRGIGNRFRGVREEEAVDSGFSAREEVIDAAPDKGALSKGDVPNRMAASDQSDAEGGETDTPLPESTDAGMVDEAGATSSETEDDEETFTDFAVEDDANTDDDTGSNEDAPAPDSDDDVATVTITDGSGSIVSGGDDTTITITDGDGSTVTGDGAATWITISDGSSDDGSLIIENSVDTESSSNDSAEPPEEPEREPHPEPEPEPEPQPDSDDVVSVGSGEDADEVIVIDGATPVEADRPETIRPDQESGTESPGFISAADAVRAGLIAPEDLRVQASSDFQGRFAGLISNDDDDDDDGLIPARQDDRIEIPKIDNQPAPGSGPPNLRSADVANPEASPLLRSTDDLQVSRSLGDIGLTRDGGGTPESTIPPVVEGTTYSAFSASSDDDDNQDDGEQDQTSESTQVVGVVDQDGNLVWHPDGWWASTGGPGDESIWISGSSASGPNPEDGVWDGGGYWAYLDGEVVWVAGPDGEGPPGEPPEYTPSYSSEDFGYGDPFDLSGSGSDDASSESSPAADEEEGDETDGATTDGGDSSESGQNAPSGDYVLTYYDDDGNLRVSQSGTEGYWLFPGGPDGQPEWHGEGDPPGEPPDVSWVGPPEAYVSPADDSPTGGEHESAEDDDDSVSEDASPAYEPPPMFTIGDPVSSGGQPAGISPADLLVSTGPDIGQYIDTERLQERLAQNSEGDDLAPDEIERPSITLERAPGEGPPQVGSLDVMESVVLRTSATGGNVLEGPEEAEELPQVRPNLDLERAPVAEITQDPALNIGKVETLAGDSEAGEPSKVNSDRMAGDSEAGEPSKVAGTDAMAGDSEAGEPSKVLDAAIERAQPLEFVTSPDAPTLDAPIDFKAAPLDLQPQSVAQVETAIPAAIEPQSTMAEVQPGFPVDAQPLISNENITDWELRSHAGDPSDDDDDPVDGM